MIAVLISLAVERTPFNFGAGILGIRYGSSSAEALLPKFRDCGGNDEVGRNLDTASNGLAIVDERPLIGVSDAGRPSGALLARRNRGGICTAIGSSIANIDLLLNYWRSWNYAGGYLSVKNKDTENLRCWVRIGVIIFCCR
jgi:hypothetical protein